LRKSERNFIQDNVQAFAGGKAQEASLTYRRELAKNFSQGKIFYSKKIREKWGG
jgi:hypothetical protein